MPRSPVLFVSHGAPSVALEDNAYTRALSTWGATLRPSAVVIVSAHWEQRQPARVTSAGQHQTLHDFSGFPAPLYQLRYPAPGHPALAAEIAGLLESAEVPALLDPSRPLDHGAWVPLRFLFPKADVPVVAVSLPWPREPRLIARIGEALCVLRDRGVVLVGSGGAVHNLSAIRFDDKDGPAQPWAKRFDAWIAARVAARDLESLLAWRKLAPDPDLAHPTTEHLDPIFFAAGAGGPSDRAETLHEGFQYGSVSMRTFALVDRAA